MSYDPIDITTPALRRRLTLLEQVHRDRVGNAFCYCATEWQMEDNRGRKHGTGL